MEVITEPKQYVPLHTVKETFRYRGRHYMILGLNKATHYVNAVCFESRLRVTLDSDTMVEEVKARVIIEE